MSQAPEGFEYTVGAGSVVIHHRGRLATTLRGTAAARFQSGVESHDPQALMARLTGNYRRGNERLARQHPRNRGH